MKILQIAVGLLLLSVVGCASNSATSSVYDVDKAIQEAGKYVEDDKAEFFMFHIPASSPMESTKETLKKHLLESSKANANLAIIGADHTLNFSILKLALLETSDESLVGSNIIYVGDSEQFEELRKLALRAGATFKSATYPAQ